MSQAWDAMLNEDDLFSSPTLNDQICYDDCMPPIYDDCDIYESGFGRVLTLDNYYPTILEGVEFYYNDKSGFGEVMTLFRNDSTIRKRFHLTMVRTKLLLMMIIVMILML